MSSEYLFKIVAIGSGGVGKTSLIRRFAEGKFSDSYLPTLGVDITTKIFHFGEKKAAVKLIVVDTAGQEYFGRLRPTYYRGANGALIVFDVTDIKSFNALPKWLDELRPNVRAGIPKILIGNKNDLQDEIQIDQEQARNFAEENDMPYFETSAKEGQNVNEIFKHIAKDVLRYFEEHEKPKK
ncbi:MAG: Rab family GTPase [Candidatus Hodarchaeota archaeon]